jgi:predicted secreted protein
MIMSCVFFIRQKRVILIQKMLLFIFCIAIIFSKNDFCNGISMTYKDMDNKETVIVKKNDNGKKIKVKCGDVIQIELEGMGSAGYQWYIDNLNSEYLELLTEETKAISEGKIGAPVLRIWRFKAHKNGYTEIKMDYYRTWEGKEKTTEHFLIRLNIY